MFRRSSIIQCWFYKIQYFIEIMYFIILMHRLIAVINNKLGGDNKTYNKIW